MNKISFPKRSVFLMLAGLILVGIVWAATLTEPFTTAANYTLSDSGKITVAGLPADALVAGGVAKLVVALASLLVILLALIRLGVLLSRMPLLVGVDQDDNPGKHDKNKSCEEKVITAGRHLIILSRFQLIHDNSQKTQSQCDDNSRCIVEEVSDLLGNQTDDQNREADFAAIEKELGRHPEEARRADEGSQILRFAQDDNGVVCQ